MSYNIFKNFGYLLEPVSSDLVETETHVNSFVAYCICMVGGPQNHTAVLVHPLCVKSNDQS